MHPKGSESSQLRVYLWLFLWLAGPQPRKLLDEPRVEG
jgi:hypothetical protein